MTGVVLDRLLLSLDVAVEALAVCEVGRDYKLVAGELNNIEVHYVLSGTMHLDIPGRESLVCPTGSVVLVPPGMAQTIGATGAAARELRALDQCRTLPGGMLHFDAAEGGAGDLRFVCGKVKATISGAYGLLDALRHPIVENVSDHDGVSAMFRMMAAERDVPSLGTRAMMGALMKACLLVVLRRHFQRGGHETTLLAALRDPRLGRAVTLVLEQPAARHSVATLATAAGMSRSAFAREFSRAMSLSPMEFVARTRLHHAAELLRSTDMPVKVIAANIGFASRSHFSRAFRDGYGADPSAFRRAASGQAEAAA